jgi:predicted LPLAT superfamily acyltransferase
MRKHTHRGVLPMHKICAIIPTCNHYQALLHIISKLHDKGLTIVIIDDGSNEPTKAALNNLPKSVTVLTHPINRGKGAAFLTGMRWAQDKGYTHVFQLDADGQHSLDQLDAFLDLSQRNPHALISGQPIYDQSMPRARRIGRWFTHVWVWIRIYPIKEALRVMTHYPIGHRMEFDTEIMVRLFWEGTPVVMSPVRVTYPEGNTSNFHVLRDNWRITKMHTKMVFLLLMNLPRILRHRPAYHDLDLPTESTHWASMKERAPILGLFFLAHCYRLLGKKACTVIGLPIVGYYYLVNRGQRLASQEFLSRAGVKNPNSFRHFMSFFEMALDKFAAWIGQMTWEQVTYGSPLTFEESMEPGKGAVLFVSHLGNMDYCRAASSQDHQQRLHVLLHSKNSERYHQLLRAFNPLSTINVIEVTEVGPDTLIYLKDRVAAGDWVVIAADRVPIAQNGRTTNLPFLGHSALFSQGPYILASLLECPVFMSIAVRDKGVIRVFLEKMCERIELDRRNKDETIKKYASIYCNYLERFAKKYPYQWFNFFDFWKKNT